jgi:uncharacterized protein (TIGR03437 family)
MFNKTLLFTLVVASFTLMMSCNDSGPGKISLEISAVSPDSGSVGTEVTIDGSGFLPKASDNIVKFNDTEAQVINVTSEKIVTEVPVGATSGPIVVEVDGKEVTGPSFIITDGNGGSAPPKVNSLDPTEGPVQTAVTITGSNFSSIASENTVTFGDTKASVSAASTTELTAIVPKELSPGMYDVRVAVDEQTALAPDQFTITQDDGDNTNNPSIGNIDPTEGPTGTEVTITGENFGPNAEDNTVTFNGTEANINAASETVLVAVVPEDATTGPVAVAVDGKTAIGPNFTVTDDGGGGGPNAPSIDSINPTEGPVGTSVTISGSNFSNTASENTVTFGGTEASISAVSTTELTVIVPDGLSPGTLAVQVIVNGQTATGPDFTITDDGSGGGNTPSIGGISPTEGPTGTEVTITGENFGPNAEDNTITFNGTEANINSASETELVAVVPDDATTGPVAVTVGGQTTTGPEFTVTDNGSEGDAPTVDTIDPTEGPVGTSVTISGSNFSNTAAENTVTFGGTEASVSAASASELTVVVPEGLSTGAVAVEVTVGGQTATGPDFTVTDDGSGGDNNPSIGSINPTEGPVGTEVTISGENFSATPDDNTVTFDGTEATVNSASETELVAVVPEGATTGPVAVTVGEQSATGPEFTVTDGDDDGDGNAPTIGEIAPTEGPTGTEVTLTGSNFGATADDNTVQFGGTDATINSASATEVKAVVPDGLSPGDVEVTLTANEQSADAPQPFTVTDDGDSGGNNPSIGGIDPTEGPTGTEVTISGENFAPNAGDNAVTFGDTEASVTNVNTDGTQLTVTVPEGLQVDQAYTVSVMVGEQSADAPDQFTVTAPAPSIDAINPTEGQTGTEVTLTGSNFGATGDDNTVQFGGTDATINSASPTEVKAVVPDGLSPGAVDVTLTANGQTATAPQQFTVILPAPPAIDAIDPTSGTTGTEVTITGENFAPDAGDNMVEFGNAEANVTSASNDGTELVVEAPGGLNPGDVVPVSVTVDEQTADGPDFTVLEEGSPQFPITGSNATIDYGGCSLCGITNPNNVVDGNTDNFATVNLPLSIASGYYVSVESAGNIPAGGTAGFVVSNQGGLIGLDLLEGITITTYLDGTVQETISDAALLNLEVVSGTTDRQFVSFQTSNEFDEIRIEFGSLLGADSDYLVYAAYGGMEAESVPGPAISSVSPERGPEGSEVTITGENFSATAGDNTVTFNGTQVTNIISASETELVVEVPTGATTGPVEVSTAGGTATSTDDFVVGAVPLTGSGLTTTSDIQGVCLGCDVTNTSNVIDSDGDNFASINIAVGVGGSGYVGVENTAEVMSGGGRAGFIVSRAGGAIDLSLIENVTIETYLDGTLQESESGSSLLLLDLLSGTSTDRQFLGFDTTEDFDQIVISLGALVGADATYEVYSVYDDYFVTE